MATAVTWQLHQRGHTRDRVVFGRQADRAWVSADVILGDKDPDDFDVIEGPPPVPSIYLDLNNFLCIVLVNIFDLPDESTFEMAEILSPRSVNIRNKKISNTKSISVRKQPHVSEKEQQIKTAEEKREKEKHLASPPPKYVIQPPGPGGVLSEKYATGQFLGKGGFAICHEGELVGKKYGGQVHKFALKIVKAKMSVKKMEEKFRTELQIHSKMRHPNIVEFHRAFTFQDNTYIVLELCPNGSVMDMMRKRRCLSLPEIRRYGVQLCGAIKYMHARNVIHRDLKMGNLFLDHNMNIKIGDFGLAALVVSEKEVKGASRRTTMCGTPNYIAPEILEKRKNGHDHKVDIWAIGVIFFALMTGFPPFQSHTQDDIYRKVKSVEYVWPVEKCQNDIPAEAKTLVSSLLKSDAEERPDPDRIVAHPFFTMHAGRAIPLSIDPKCRTAKPQWLEQTYPYGDVMSETEPRIELSRLGEQCGVGYRFDGISPINVVGDGIGQSLYYAFLAEEAAGRTPVVPLPDDAVYTPSTISSRFPTPINLQSTALAYATDGEDLFPRSPLHPRYQRSSVREAPPSHAAVLRAKASHFGNGGKEKFTLPSKPAQVPSSMRDAQSINVQPESIPNSSASNPVGSRSGSQTLPRIIGRITRSATVKGRTQAISNDADRDDRRPATSRATIGRSVSARVVTSSQGLATAPTNAHAMLNTMRQTRSADTKTRIATTNTEEMLEAAAATKEALRGPLPANVYGDREVIPLHAERNAQSLDWDIKLALIGPDEKADFLPSTKSGDIETNLRLLWENLGDYLKSTSDGQYDPYLTAPCGSKSLRSRPVVVKWVDYTNKFGIGYVLANGTVGCVFNGRDGRKSTCIIVHKAEEHLKNRKFTAYTERHQIVPKDGGTIEFFENGDGEGIRRVLASPGEYQVEVHDGVAQKLGPGTSTFQNEKRRLVSLWEKFAKYMTINLGLGSEESNEAEGFASIGAPTYPGDKRQLERYGSSPFVKFYQRLGNVGIWGFGNGSFQFNFPDHTKLVISDDGYWADFYHLPTMAAKLLKTGAPLDSEALDERTALSYPLKVLLQGRCKGKNFRDVILANELPAKVAFVKEVIGAWLEQEGIGRMGGSREEKKMMWEGMKEITGGKEKLVWITVGRRGGDDNAEIVYRKAAT